MAVRIEARAAVPLTVGAELFTGGADATTPVGALPALTVPSALLALTSTRSESFSSATVSVYVEAVAPRMLLQLLPSGERCHW